MKRIGYVLSGGGARGFAHLGVIKLLEELGVKPIAIAGTSVGAVIGALYAGGKSSLEILEILKRNRYFSWHNISLLKQGFFSMGTLRKVLKDNIGEEEFGQLKVKLFVAATDLAKGESVIISEGNLLDAIIASASVPVIFEPVRTGGRLLVDGGILDNFPVEPLEGICDVIIGSHVNKMTNELPANTVLKTADMLDRCFHLAIADKTYSRASLCDFFIETDLAQYNSYDVRKADMIFKSGYNTALLYKDRLMEMLEISTTP